MCVIVMIERNHTLAIDVDTFFQQCDTFLRYCDRLMMQTNH